MNRNADPNVRIAKEIRARRTLSRGVLVLDTDLIELKRAVRDGNVSVVELAAGTGEWEIKELLLPHRIFATNRPGDFVEDAAAYEFGIVALNRHAGIDTSPTYRTNSTAQLLLRDKRYLEKFDTQETQIEKLQGVIKELHEAENQQRKDYEGY